MRASVIVVLGLAACGSDGGGGGGDADVARIDATLTDGPPAGTPLVDRLSVTTIATPAGVMAGRSNYRIWGGGDLRVSPVFTVPFADCGTLVGYTTGTATPTARVARLDATDTLVTTFDLGAFELRGLAAEPDGHFAALLWDATPNPAELHVARFDAAGAAGWSTAWPTRSRCPPTSASARAGSSTAPAATAPTSTSMASPGSRSATRVTASSTSTRPPARCRTAGRGAARTA